MLILAILMPIEPLRWHGHPQQLRASVLTNALQSCLPGMGSPVGTGTGGRGPMGTTAPCSGLGGRAVAAGGRGAASGEGGAAVTEGARAGLVTDSGKGGGAAVRGGEACGVGKKAAPGGSAVGEGGGGGGEAFSGLGGGASDPSGSTACCSRRASLAACAPASRRAARVHRNGRLTGRLRQKAAGGWLADDDIVL